MCFISPEAPISELFYGSLDKQKTREKKLDFLSGVLGKHRADFFKKVPTDIILLIFKNLDLKDLLSLTLVNKSFNRIIKNNNTLIKNINYVKSMEAVVQKLSAILLGYSLGSIHINLTKHVNETYDIDVNFNLVKSYEAVFLRNNEKGIYQYWWPNPIDNEKSKIFHESVKRSEPKLQLKIAQLKKSYR